VLSSRIRTPTAILLISLGLLAHEIISWLNITIPNLDALLPILGTVGLIMIVLEGALELKVDRSKVSLIKRSFIMALLPMILLAFTIAFAFYYTGQGSFKNCLANAIPLSIISSAVAIPSVRNFTPEKKEFIIYESSLSDILGVLFFNFVALNQEIGIESVEHFGLQILLIIIITIIATIGIIWLINKIDYHVKHIPVLIIVILIYSCAKIVHLPGLVFVLICGLFLGNIELFKNRKWISQLDIPKLNLKISQFRELTIEATFVVRILFFILFGFLIEVTDVLNTDTIFWACGIVGVMFFLRIMILFIVKAPIFPLIFVAPRGLITVLLFYSILPADRIPMVNKSLIIQVVLITAIAMMIGLMFSKQHKELSTETVCKPG
jgi:hypothetical protein